MTDQDLNDFETFEEIDAEIKCIKEQLGVQEEIEQIKIERRGRKPLVLDWLPDSINNDTKGWRKHRNKVKYERKMYRQKCEQLIDVIDKLMVLLNKYKDNHQELS